MRTYKKPVIPEVLEPMWDEHAQEAHERLASISLDTFMQTHMPQKQVMDDVAAYGVLKPSSGEYDETDAVVVPLVAGHTLSPAQALGARMMLDIVSDNRQLIAFPNNTTDSFGYSLSRRDIREVAAGNFRPIAEKQLLVLEKLGILTVDIVGYSQGATIGAAMMQVAQRRANVEVGSAGLFEPANVEPRSTVKLRLDFFRTGIFNLINAINQSAIPALDEAQHADSLTHALTEIPKGLLAIKKNEKLPENTAIVKGFTKPLFLGNLEVGLRDTDTRTLLAWGSKSKIARPEAMNALYEDGVLDLVDSTGRVFRDRVCKLEIPGVGHEWGDNITAKALAAKLAINS